MSDIWQFALRRGYSKDPSEGACLLDAVSWFEYGTLGDHPPCVCPVLAAYARGLNDLLPDDKRQELIPLIVRLPGTVDPESELERAAYLAWPAVSVLAPAALTAAAARLPGKDATVLLTHATLLSNIPRFAQHRDAAAAVDAAHDAAAAVLAATSAAAPAANAAAAAAAVAHANAANAATAAAAAGDNAVIAAAAAAATAAATAAAAFGAGQSKIYDQAIAALYGALDIGRQASPISPPRIERANLSFAEASK